MADDDNFDIDIYGDETPNDNYQDTSVQQADVKPEDDTMQTESHLDESTETLGEVKTEPKVETVQPEGGAVGGAANNDAHHDNGTQQIASTGGSANALQLHKQAPVQQGMKRKKGDEDERPLDPGATAALMLNDLNWWVGEDDIRGWANQSGCEDELVDITFNEHKVNGKSKGQVYVQLQSPQAATALKHQLEALYKDQAHAKKPTAVFNPPHINPFKTLPKDVPAREKNRGERSSSTNYSGHQGSNQSGNYNRFNNNRGNFNNRGGGGNNNMGFQRNFSSPVAGNMGGAMGGYGSPAPMNNFGGGQMGGMNNFGGGGFNRGGMMNGGMRGGMPNRGGRGGNMGMNNMGMNMPMGGNMMGMGGGGMMGMGGNMGMMGGMGRSSAVHNSDAPLNPSPPDRDANAQPLTGAPGGFGGQQGHFNPAFFSQAQQGGDGNWNPHGAKRPRPE